VLSSGSIVRRGEGNGVAMLTGANTYFGRTTQLVQTASPNPHANDGKLTVDLDLPDFRGYAIPVTKPATERHASTRQLGMMMRDMFKGAVKPKNFRLFCPRRNELEPAGQRL
jgi:phosphoketolase